MQVDLTKTGERIDGAMISDGSESLILSVHRIDWRTFGTLKTADGLRSWAHNSITAINLLILHALEAVTVRELLEDLGLCDEARSAKK